MDDKTIFLRESLSDIQATIRATDVKIGALITGILIPFSKIDEIWNTFSSLQESLPSLAVAVFQIMFFVLWFLAIYSFSKGLLSIENPSKHIVNSDQCKGVYFGGHLFNFHWIDSFVNRSEIKAEKDVSAHTNELDISDEVIFGELAFEQMKLIYIRDLKTLRLKTGFNIGLVWFLLGLIVLTYTKIC